MLYQDCSRDSYLENYIYPQYGPTMIKTFQGDYVGILEEPYSLASESAHFLLAGRLYK